MCHYWIALVLVVVRCACKKMRHEKSSANVITREYNDRHLCHEHPKIFSISCLSTHGNITHCSTQCNLYSSLQKKGPHDEYTEYTQTHADAHAAVVYMYCHQKSYCWHIFRHPTYILLASLLSFSGSTADLFTNDYLNIGLCV